jgi:ketosteroid isomerase-like protein
MGGLDDEVLAKLWRGYAAFNRGEFDNAMSELAFDPEFEFVRAAFGRQGTIRGAAAYREWMQPDAIESQSIEVVDFRVVGHKVLVQQHGSGTGAHSGIELSVDTWAVWTFSEDGDVVRVEAFSATQKAEAFAAAGIRE